MKSLICVTNICETLKSPKLHRLRSVAVSRRSSNRLQIPMLRQLLPNSVDACVSHLLPAIRRLAPMRFIRPPLIHSLPGNWSVCCASAFRPLCSSVRMRRLCELSLFWRQLCAIRTPNNGTMPAATRNGGIWCSCWCALFWVRLRNPELPWIRPSERRIQVMLFKRRIRCLNIGLVFGFELVYETICINYL